MSNFKDRKTNFNLPFKTPEDIIYYKKLYLQLGKIFCEYLAVDYNTYVFFCFNKSRKEPYVLIKHLSRYAFSLAGWNFTDITVFENLDHSSIVNSFKAVENLRDSDFKFREACNKIMEDKRVFYIFKRIKCKSRHINKYTRNKKNE
jgi:hypothetical protein